MSAVLFRDGRDLRGVPRLAETGCKASGQDEGVCVGTGGSTRSVLATEKSLPRRRDADAYFVVMESCLFRLGAVLNLLLHVIRLCRIRADHFEVAANGLTVPERDRL